MRLINALASDYYGRTYLVSNEKTVIRLIGILKSEVKSKNLLKNSLSNLQEVILFEATSIKEVEELVYKNKFFLVISNLALPDSIDFEILKYFKNSGIIK